MIGTTNIISRKGETEKVNLTLKTDQSSHGVLIGAIITVSYESYSKDYTWNGTSLVIEVPAYVEYTITFGTVSEYMAPASMTYTAQTGNSRTITATYKAAVEKLTVTVSGLTSGFTVSVVNSSTGEVIGSQSTTSKTYNIKSGVSYYVKASKVDGYATPGNSATYTAITENSRSVTMTYVAHSGTTNPSNGVYIQDTDGYYHTEAEWDGTYTPNGVAVITSNCRFVIALEDAYTSTCFWGGYGTGVSGITTTTNVGTAKTDYDGEDQTTTIINALKGTNDGDVDGAPAAEYCRAYTFPDGSVGYMGATGEWQAALDNISSVMSALSKCSGTPMSSYYWTSTQSSSINSWYVYWDGAALYYGARNINNYVRAFASI